MKVEDEAQKAMDAARGLPAYGRRPSSPTNSSLNSSRRSTRRRGETRCLDQGIRRLQMEEGYPRTMENSRCGPISQKWPPSGTRIPSYYDLIRVSKPAYGLHDVRRFLTGTRDMNGGTLVIAIMLSITNDVSSVWEPPLAKKCGRRNFPGCFHLKRPWGASAHPPSGKTKFTPRQCRFLLPSVKDGSVVWQHKTR